MKMMDNYHIAKGGLLELGMAQYIFQPNYSYNPPNENKPDAKKKTKYKQTNKQTNTHTQ